jgi:hypothetical protein
MTKEELIARGWDTWYNPNYWVHPKTVADPTRQDFTYYGMSFEDAVKFELEDRKPIPAGYDLGSGFQVLRVLNRLTDRLQSQQEEQEATLPDVYDPES